MSQDGKGRSNSTDEQFGDLERDNDRQGWRLGDPYIDKGISASRYATQARGDFERLMSDLRSGLLNGGILGLWESSRGSRQVGEWVAMLDEMERRGVHIWVHEHKRLYDPANGRDRRTLLEDAVDSEYESYKTRGRVLRTFDAGLAEGRPHGTAAYGYRRRYDPNTGALVEQVIVPEEAEVVREIYQRLDAGHSIQALERDLKKRGIRSRVRIEHVRQPDGRKVPTEVGGIPLSMVVIRDMALNPTYKAHRRGRKGDQRTYPGNWEPIVSAEVWDRVYVRLSDPKRTTRRDGQGKHLHSMIVRCARCLAPMTSSQRRGEPWHLRCHANCGIQVNEALLDELLVDLMIGYLSRPDVVERVLKADDNNPELQAVRTSLAAVRKELADLAAGVLAKRFTISWAGQLVPGLEEQQAKLEQQEQALTSRSALTRFVGPKDEVTRRWMAAPLSAKREIARLVLSPGLLGEVRVGPTPNGPWCRHESHDRPQQTCRHRVLARLKFVRGQAPAAG